MHFGVQYEIAKDMVFETDYVGTLGRKLIGILNDNTFDGRLASGSRLSGRILRSEAITSGRTLSDRTIMRCSSSCVSATRWPAAEC